jgi:hypothetical protein
MERREKDGQFLPQRVSEKRRHPWMALTLTALAALLLTGAASMSRFSQPDDTVQKVLGTVPLIGEHFTKTKFSVCI